MRCLSLWEPWASAMATLQPSGLPVKAVETRNWELRAPFPCPLAIHAAKHPFKINDYTGNFVKAYYEFGLHKKLAYGHVVCVVWVTGSAKVEEIRESLTPLELLFGNYFDDDEQRYGFTTDPSKLKILKKPFPLKGMQGVFNWQPPEGLEYLCLA